MTALRPSLLRHLLAWTLGALLVVWGSSVWFGWQTGVHESAELTDGHLASVASLMLAQQSTKFSPTTRQVKAPGPHAELKAHDYQQSLSIVEWDAQGRVVAHSGEAPPLAFNTSEGFETIQLGQPPSPWRTFSRWDGPDRTRKVAVMLSVAERDELARDIAEQVIEPGLWLLPVIALVLVLAIRKGLRPLHELSHQVLVLDIHKDTHLKAPPHEEFQGVVRAIDTLMERYNAALERERALASEVAHELRTPLSSLSLHAASLRGELTPDERSAALRRIELDAARAGSVLSDLLALARASRTELAEAAQPLDLSDLARSVVAEYGEISDRSGHELSLEADTSCPITGHPVLLELALRNLVDNALAHTPRGTSVCVRVSSNPPVLEVSDNGRSLTREGEVTRKPGLGLGHQVVRRVAAVHGGTLETVEGETTRYRIVLGGNGLSSRT